MILCYTLVTGLFLSQPRGVTFFPLSSPSIQEQGEEGGGKVSERLRGSELQARLKPRQCLTPWREKHTPTLQGTRRVLGGWMLQGGERMGLPMDQAPFVPHSQASRIILSSIAGQAGTGTFPLLSSCLWSVVHPPAPQISRCSRVQGRFLLPDSRDVEISIQWDLESKAVTRDKQESKTGVVC